MTAVKVEGLRKIYRQKRKVVKAVDDVTFEVRRGGIVGLLGPNGAGKTTTIKCVCGLIEPDGGSVEILGRRTTGRPREAARRVAALLEGNRNIYWRLNVRENLQFFAGLMGRSGAALKKEINDLMERFGLADKAGVQARFLSRGMQQKLALGCCLVRGAPVLLLDEPTLGLDVETSHDMRGFIRALAPEKTILLSSHDMGVVEDVCDRVIVIKGGRVVADDTVAALKALFRYRRYRVNVRGALGRDAQAEIEKRFPDARVRRDADITCIEVDLPDAGRIYALFEVLRAADAPIEEIQREQCDLERAYLELVRKERS